MICFLVKTGFFRRSIMTNPKSTASIFGHPIHPMLVPFPIAFFVATLACDIAFWPTENMEWFVASKWLLGAGLVMAALAAVAGLTDFIGERKIRNIAAAWLHAGGNVAIVLAEAYNFYIRYTTGSPAVFFEGFTISTLAVALLMFTGWMGWEMVYRERVAVAVDIEHPNKIYIQRNKDEEEKDVDFPYPKDRPRGEEHRPS
jgi:uncharacterized membrane protein